MKSEEIRVDDDYEYLKTFFPEGWEEKAKELGALRRCRKMPDAGTLLRVLLMHLAEGCSLRETAVRAKTGGLIELSDVAIMDRLRSSGEWFRWMNAEMMKKWIRRQPGRVYGEAWNVRLIDGTRIKEPGPTGSSWCLHYSIGLPSLTCDEMHLMDKHGSGETFKRFDVKPGDLFMGDRAYGVPPGIRHVVDGGGAVLVRFAWNLLPLFAEGRRRFDLFKRLRSLEGVKPGDWPVALRNGETEIEGRLCAIKKSRQATERAVGLARRKSRKNGVRVMPETLEAAGYVFVFTTVDGGRLNASNILEMYRGRWQIEVVFKRLKSIMALGHLRKTDPTSAKSWIYGKLFVALLTEALLREGESFFPWGYPILDA
jgi:hypothetical protein